MRQADRGRSTGTGLSGAAGRGFVQLNPDSTRSESTLRAERGRHLDIPTRWRIKNK